MRRWDGNADAAPERVDVALTKDGMLAAINLFQSPEMGGLEHALGQDNIVHRHKKRIPAWYDAHKGRIDLDAAKRLCSDHEMGLCDHGEGWPVHKSRHCHDNGPEIHIQEAVLVG